MRYLSASHPPARIEVKGLGDSQPIVFKDFPLPEITLWLQNDMIFLPSED